MQGRKSDFLYFQNPLGGYEKFHPYRLIIPLRYAHELRQYQFVQTARNELTFLYASQNDGGGIEQQLRQILEEALGQAKLQSQVKLVLICTLKENMPVIYTEEWYAAMFEVANSQSDIPTQSPAGEWCFAFEVVGDGISPYIPRGETRNFIVRLQEGKVVAYREHRGRISRNGLDFRFTGPAHIYEGVAAGTVDPIVAGLKGTIKVRGDMRLLIRNAEFAGKIFKNIARSKSTVWPKGKPPYK